MLVTSTSGGPPVQELPNHRISINWRSGCRDLFQIQFAKQGIFIHFRYQPDAPGFLARAEVPPGRSHTVNFGPVAHATTHKVKYSHPLDGRAHFSQTGKLVTRIWNQAEPLNSSIGHFFSLEIAGIGRFRKCAESKKIGLNGVRFSFDSDAPTDPVHFHGYWLKTETGDFPAGLGNPLTLDLADGPKRAIAIAPPPSSPLYGGMVAIFTRSGPADMAVGEDDFRLMFTGGFANDLADRNVSSSFLAMQYPAGDISTMPLDDFVQESYRQHIEDGASSPLTG